MTGEYPFGALDLPVSSTSRTYVRKVVAFTPDNYWPLRDKFDFARQISSKSVVRLSRVLEEEGWFHLLYEYVPHHIESQREWLTPELLDRLKTELILLSAHFS